MSEAVFELIDTTDDERYYPIGVFMSLADAVAAVESQYEPWTLSNQAFDYDFVSLEIRERKIGLSEDGKMAWKRSWNSEYDEAADKYTFKEYRQ